MKVSFLNNGETYIEITPDEFTELKNIKSYFIELLSNDMYIERNEIDLRLSKHLSNDAKQNELLNLRNHIINDLDFNDTYKEVFSIKTGFIEFKNADLFNYFAIAYDILDDTTHAERVLKNILRVKIIERLIELEYYDLDIKVTFSNDIPYNKKYKEYFTPYGFELFDYINKNWIYKNEKEKYSEIYSFMYSITGKYGLIHCSQVKYMDFIKNYLKTKYSKVQPTNSNNHIKLHLNELRKEYKIQSNAPI